MLLMLANRAQRNSMLSLCRQANLYELVFRHQIRTFLCISFVTTTFHSASTRDVELILYFSIFGDSAQLWVRRSDFSLVYRILGKFIFLTAESYTCIRPVQFSTVQHCLLNSLWRHRSAALLVSSSTLLPFPITRKAAFSRIMLYSTCVLAEFDDGLFRTQFAVDAWSIRWMINHCLQFYAEYRCHHEGCDSFVRTFFSFLGFSMITISSSKSLSTEGVSCWITCLTLYGVDLSVW